MNFVHQAILLVWRKIADPALRLRRAVRIPRRGEVVTVLVRAAKCLIAAFLSWEIASWWLPGQQPYLAVATSLLMVNAATVYSSVTEAARSVATRTAGLSLAGAAVWLFSSTTENIVAILAIALVAGGRQNSDKRLQVASTAVLTLTAATAASVGHVVGLALVTLAGAVVGIAVNALILPPLHLGASHTSVRNLASAMGSLLDDMSHGLRERRHPRQAHAWLEKGRRLEELVVQAQENVLRGQESMRWNTRSAAHVEHSNHCEALRVLHRVSFAVRGIARTLADNAEDQHAGHHLGQLFLDRYASTLKTAGRAVEAFVQPDAARPGTDGAREGLRAAIDEALLWHETMTDLIEQGSLVKPGAWHVYGALMTDVERLLADLDGADRRISVRSADDTPSGSITRRSAQAAPPPSPRPAEESPWWQRGLPAPRYADYRGLW